MPRLMPCPSCGRHLRTVETRCPFCGSTELTTPPPAGRGAALLLGLAMTACTGTGAEQDTGTPKPAAGEGEAEVPTDSAAPTDGPSGDTEGSEPAPTGTSGLEVPGTTGEEPADGTTGAEPADGTTGEGAADDGATTEEPPTTKPKPEKMKTKYGGPRPPAKKKYGGPRPQDEPKIGPLDDL